MNSNAQGIDSFLEDITPFFYQRRITYVDVGAFNGQTFERVLDSGLKVREAHLVEPNSRALNRAKARAAKFTGNSVDFHNVAMGARTGRVRMHAAKAMTRVVSEVDGDAAASTEEEGLFDVECSTLDLLSESFSEGRVSILKIDVEGFELQVLEGARRLLSEQRADCIYIEAGLSRDGRQQCYYRDIEDALHLHGYRIFKIYEQQNEWMEDSPLLRRVNVAFLSRKFAESNPYRLTRELVQARSENTDLAARAVASEVAVRDAANAQVQARSEFERQLASLRSENTDLAARAVASEVAVRDAANAQVRARGEFEHQLASLRRENTDLVARAAASEAAAQDVAHAQVQARGDLEHQLASLRRENTDLAARAAASEAAVHEQGRLRGELRSLATQLAQVTREREAFQAAVATQSDDHKRYRRTAGKILDLARDLAQREEKALKQVAQVQTKLAKLRNRPAFRAGRAVYHGIQSPGKWLGMPVAVWRAFHDEMEIGASSPPPTAPFTMPPGSTTLTLPLSRAPRFAVVEGVGRAQTVYGRAYSSKGGLEATVHLEVSAAGAAGDDLLHLKAIGGTPLVAARQGQTLRAHVRLAADRDTPLLEFAESRALVRIAVVRPHGDFAVLILTRNEAETRLHSPLKPLAPTPAIPIDAGKSGGEPAHALAKELGAKLWSYSRYALPELERLRDDEHASRSEREWAAWFIARWHYVNEDYRAAVTNVEMAEGFVDKPQHRLRLLRAQSLIASGQAAAAAKVIARNLKSRTKPDYALLESTVLRGQALQEGKPLREAEAVQLRALNRLLEAADLTSLEVRDPRQPLSLGNLRGRPVSGPSEQNLKVSVVMATFNSAASIGWVLASLLEQTWRNIEIIVVDDLSDDDTVEIVSKIAGNDPRVRLLRNPENVGAYRSRNAGARAASGDLLTVHDSDDWSHPQKIERQIAALIAHPQAVAVVSHWVRVSEQLEVLGSWIPKGTLYDVNFSSLIFRRDLLDAIGYWDDVAISADAEFYARIQTVYGKEAIVKLPQAQLLAFSLTRPDSLTRSKATHLSTLFFGLRRNYREAYTRWHAELHLDDLPFESAPTRRPFVVPLGNRTERKPHHRYDIVVISDFAMRGGAFVSTLNYVLAAALSGRRVAIFHWRKYSLAASTPLQPRLLEAARAHGIDILSPTDVVSCDVLLFGYPAILAHKIEPFPKIQTRQVLVIVNQFANRLVTGDDPQYDPAEARQRLRSLFGMEGVWIPISAWVKRLMTADPRYPAPYEHPWNPMIDADTWCQRPTQWRGTERTHPVVGRHGRDSYTKWPSTKEALSQAYGVGQAWEVRFLGGADYAIQMLGTQPENWQVVEFDGMSAQEFLDDLDFYIHYPHEDYIEEFGRAVMEAMARGIPVVLPHQFKETFGDAATYAHPSEVAGTIAALWTSRTKYMEMAAVARDFVLRNCDIKQFDVRLTLIIESSPLTNVRNMASYSMATEGASFTVATTR